MRKGTIVILSAAAGLICWNAVNAGDGKSGSCNSGPCETGVVASATVAIKESGSCTASETVADKEASSCTASETVAVKESGSCNSGPCESTASQTLAVKKSGTCGSAPCESVAGETVALKDEAPDAKKQFDAIKALVGTWESTEKGPDGKAGVCIFKLTANGSVVHETMLPGTAHEMVNMYHLDGDKLIITHYCAQGIQPRMKMSNVDGNTMKFDFLDCTNLLSPDAPRMNDLSLTINGDTIKESWGYFKDGKVSDHTTIEMKKKV